MTNCSVNIQRIRVLPQLLSNHILYSFSTLTDAKKLLTYVELGETGQSVFYRHIHPREHSICPYRHLHMLTQSIFITKSIVVKVP